jgi:hypothetical protein
MCYKSKWAKKEGYVGSLYSLPMFFFSLSTVSTLPSLISFSITRLTTALREEVIMFGSVCDVILRQRNKENQKE